MHCILPASSRTVGRDLAKACVGPTRDTKEAERYVHYSGSECMMVGVWTPVSFVSVLRASRKIYGETVDQW
jgi:hypothetical protein